MTDKKKTSLGQILKSKDGKSLYIKFAKDVTIKSGSVAFLRKPSEEVKYAVSKGWKDEEEGMELIEAYADGGRLSFVRFTIGDILED